MEDDYNLYHYIEHDKFTSPTWDLNPPNSHHFLDVEIPSNESILEDMIESKRQWEYMHYISFFLHESEKLEVGMQNLVSPGDIKW